jgi:prefoldin subunit 5
MTKKILSAPMQRKLTKALAKVEKHKATIAKSRDALREAISEIEAISESIDEGLEELQRGVDAISKYV